MIQNGILLSFTRLATRLCFLDVRLSVLCLPLSRRPESCTHVLSKTFPNQSRRTGRTAPVCLLTKLQYQTWAYYLWVSICILLSTLCTLCFKAAAFSRSSTALSGFLIPTTSSLLFPLSPSASKYVCVCGESSGIRWTRGSSQRRGLFSALNEIWQLEYAIHNLSYPPNWKAREELNAGEGSAVCFCRPGSTQLLQMLSVCCVWPSRRPMCTVDSTAPGSRRIIEVMCNNNSSQVRCFQGPTHEATKCLPCCCLSAISRCFVARPCQY